MQFFAKWPRYTLYCIKALLFGHYINADIIIKICVDVSARKRKILQFYNDTCVTCVNPSWHFPKPSEHVTWKEQNFDYTSTHLAAEKIAMKIIARTNLASSRSIAIPWMTCPV